MKRTSDRARFVCTRVRILLPPQWIGSFQKEMACLSAQSVTPRRAGKNGVDEVFRIDGQCVLVGGIPAAVCARCGEQAFSRETVEKVRSIVHGEAKATKPVPMQVFDFVS